MPKVLASYPKFSDNDGSHNRGVTLKNCYMHRSIRIFITASLLIVFVCLSIGGYAQSMPEDPSPLDPAVPIDGGISLLLAAGAALGGRKLFAKSREGKD